MPRRGCTRATSTNRRRRRRRRLLLLLGLPLLRLGLLRLRPLLRGQLAQEPKPDVGLVSHPEPAALLDAALQSRHVPSTCHGQHKASVSQELQTVPPARTGSQHSTHVSWSRWESLVCVCGWESLVCDSLCVSRWLWSRTDCCGHCGGDLLGARGLLLHLLQPLLLRLRRRCPHPRNHIHSNTDGGGR